MSLPRRYGLNSDCDPHQQPFNFIRQRPTFPLSESGPPPIIADEFERGLHSFGSEAFPIMKEIWRLSIIIAVLTPDSFSSRDFCSSE